MIDRDDLSLPVPMDRPGRGSGFLFLDSVTCVSNKRVAGPPKTIALARRREYRQAP
jgi:hypothetical protein